MTFYKDTVLKEGKKEQVVGLVISYKNQQAF